MSADENGHEGRRTRASSEEETVRRLFAAAGPPPPTPEIDIARIKEAARAEWRRRYLWPRRRRTVRRWSLAAAAALLAALAFLWWPRLTGQSATKIQLASVEHLNGRAELVGEAGSLAVGTAIAAGGALRTGEDGRIALRLADGRSLRLDTGSELRLLSAERVELVRGALYVDAGAKSRGRGPMVATTAGSFAEIGTQFEVRLHSAGGSAARLRVREGAVRFERAGRSVPAVAGEELGIDVGGAVTRREIAVYGPQWEWVVDAAATPEIGGWSLARFLEWLARETGWQIEYADAESARLAATTQLHGSIERLSPAEAASVVLTSSGFSQQLTDGRLRVWARDGD